MERPKVGVGIYLVKNGEVLVGQRLNAHGEGSWCFPGGHLEFGESWEDCAIREVAEETGLTIGNLAFAGVTNDIFQEENKHYVTIYIRADWISGEPEVLEPNKMVRWRWANWDNLPQPLFIPFQNFIATGFRPDSPSQQI